jgi:hypothetical protein
MKPSEVLSIINGYIVKHNSDAEIPIRVISKDGAGLSIREARKFGVTYSGYFVRADGWTLGFNSDTEYKAHRIWADQWIAVVLFESGKHILRVMEDIQGGDSSPTEIVMKGKKLVII